MEDKLPKRKAVRWENYDYSTEGRYFITICTEGRKQILSQIVGGDVLDAPKTIELFSAGKIVEKYLNQLNDFYSNIEIDQYVIMPNHIHMILFVFGGGPSRTSAPTKQHSVLSQFVSTLKRFCNKEHGENLFQRSFFDRVIRNREEYENVKKYIFFNPDKWEEDDLYF